ncbi:MAG: ABC transporter ATP-binding protein [Spirochaetota bacterium]|nr:MAG: ABC transporter ATP-binding protein [Spirochaetota bacterium]
MSLVLSNIRKSYPDFEVDLSFDIEAGKLITLLGPSGCGKTTTLHIIAGFITPDKGKIILEGKRVDSLPPYMREAGLVFQDYALFPNMNVAGNIAFGLRMHGWSKRKIDNRVNELLELIHLPGYNNRSVDNLSGGEQQRVALARALAPNPKILLLDEPLSALDAKLRKNLRADIRRIQKKLKVTTVYVTHDQEESFAISDRIAVMKDGKIEQVGTAQEIYNSPETLFVANFVGLTNTIEGMVSKKKGTLIEVETQFGKLSVKYTENLEPGSSVILIFRPERCSLYKVKGDNNVLEGTITNCEYQGDSTLLELSIMDRRFTVKLSDSAVCAVGDRAHISFSPEHCWILKNIF